MSASKVIVVGDGIVDTDEGLPRHLDILRVDSCRDVKRLLERDSSVHLVCPDVESRDGNWCDVLRLVVDQRVSAEVRVLGWDGHTVLGLEVNPRGCSVSTVDAALHKSPTTASSVGTRGKNA